MGAEAESLCDILQEVDEIAVDPGGVALFDLRQLGWQGDVIDEILQILCAERVDVRPHPGLFLESAPT